MPYHLDYKIPVLDGLANAGGYKNIPIDLSDSRASEPLVKTSDYGVAGESFYARADGQNAPYFEKIRGAIEYVWCRKTVAEKLAAANARLRSFGVELFMWDAYRSIECQQGIWDFFSRQALQEMPDASEEDRKRYVLNFVSDPTAFDPANPHSWPVHACGGAVDLTLQTISTRKLLDMGVGFDEMSNLLYSDALERKVIAGELKENDPRVENRRLLHWAMMQEGFTNYPFEFWHFDYGDQMYVLYAKDFNILNKPQAAWYGYMDSPEG
ncbi:MAG: M15 family metallopeptidase [Alphaproteobacteria bacterium]|nr:M15 family metallopeptidase [Alphaproteobacteria bacterium]